MGALRSEIRGLQRERVWWGLGNTLLIALLLTGAAAAPGVLDELRARRFVLADDRGVERAELTVLAHGPCGCDLPTPRETTFCSLAKLQPITALSQRVQVPPQQGSRQLRSAT